MVEAIVRSIVNKVGGFREKEIMRNYHRVVQTETWNDEHRVFDVISEIEDADGHRDSFSVDIMTERICG